MEVSPIKVDRFRIESELGRGASSIVYRAFDPQLERAVAIKLLSAAHKPPGFADRCTIDLRAPGTGTIAEETLVEARVMAKLSHPNVLPVFEVGTVDDGVYFVLELVDGKNLRHWLAGKPSREQITGVLAQAARGLAAAHAADVVHRDFKPDNVLVGADGRVRVADFGLSSLFRKVDTRSMTRVGGLAGTPRYMAPELWDGVPASQKSDVYALALTCAEAYSDDAPADQLERALAGIAEPVREVILAGLGKEPDTRPSVDQFVAALEGRSRRRSRSWLWAAAAGALAVGVWGATALRGYGASCGAPPLSWWHGGDELAAALRANGVADPSEYVRWAEGIVGDVQKRRDEVCADDRYVRCLDRRLLELRGRLDRAVQPGTKPALVESLLSPAGVDLASCATAQATPVSSEVDAEMYAELGSYYGPYQELASRLPALEAFAARAESVSNPELAAMAWRRRAGYDSSKGDLAHVDDIYARAQRLAEVARSSAIASLVLADRASLAMRRDDLRGARSLIKLALEHSEHDSPAIRFRVLSLATTIADNQGDYDSTLEYGRAALAVYGETVPPTWRWDVVSVESVIGWTLANRGKFREAKASADAAVRHARAWQPGDDVLRKALRKAAVVYTDAGDVDTARAYMHELVEVWSRVPRTDPAEYAHAQAEIGDIFLVQGELEKARVTLETALEGSPPELLWRIEYDLGRCLNELGRYDDARVQYERALDYTIDKYGRHDDSVLLVMEDMAGNELDRRDFRHTEELLATLTTEFTAKHDQVHLAELDGLLRAEIALAQQRWADAEAFARKANAALAELGRPGEASYHLHLAKALLGQKRYADARDAAMFALDSDRNHVLTDKHGSAKLLFVVAQAEAGLGHSAEARASAERALEPLAPDEKLRVEIDAWLARQSSR